MKPSATTVHGPSVTSRVAMHVTRVGLDPPDARHPERRGEPLELRDVERAVRTDRDARRHALCGDLVRQVADLGRPGRASGERLDVVGRDELDRATSRSSRRRRAGSRRARRWRPRRRSRRAWCRAPSRRTGSSRPRPRRGSRSARTCRVRPGSVACRGLTLKSFLPAMAHIRPGFTGAMSVTPGRSTTSWPSPPGVERSPRRASAANRTSPGPAASPKTGPANAYGGPRMQTGRAPPSPRRRSAGRSRCGVAIDASSEPLPLDQRC